MAKRKIGWYWHVHHDKLMEWCYDYAERLHCIETKKPDAEKKLRKRLFKRVRGKLPAPLLKARARYDAARARYEAARARYDAARAKYGEAGARYDAAVDRYDAAVDRYDAAVARYGAAVARCNAQIELLHKAECPDCPWDGSSIFTKKQEKP